jgi:hypothetical protein
LTAVDSPTKGAVELSEVGLNELLQSAGEIISKAIKDIVIINSQSFFNLLQMKSYYDATNRLDNHFVAIDKFTELLQQAVTVASYNVTMEQFENTLNVTKAFKYEEFR